MSATPKPPEPGAGLSAWEREIADTSFNNGARAGLEHAADLAELLLTSPLWTDGARTFAAALKAVMLRAGKQIPGGESAP